MNNNNMQNVRDRFAPSPTGYLHIGSLRTALYNYLFAKKNNGSFILRIEDTDQTRYVQGAVENLIETLKWAGINYDEGPQKDGSVGPYVQSQRLEIYKKYANELIKNNHAYYCFCSPERLESVREKQIAQKLPPAYDRHCRDIDVNVSKKRIDDGEKFVIRMKVPLHGQLTFTDLVRGIISISYNNIDDQVLLKSDGFPTYHLAVVIDDHLMQISHVIRGEEWLSSTPKHLLLYKYFGWQPPEFAHLPLLLNPDRSKLSKRQGDVAVEDYRAKGYLKEALINFVALLGWNPGTEQEIFSLNDLIKIFSLENVNKSGSVFDINKLDWMNGLYIRQKSAKELFELIIKDVDPLFLKEISFFNIEQILVVIDLYKERAKTLKELCSFIINLDKVPHECEKEALEGIIKNNSISYLENLILELEVANDFSKENLSKLIKEFCKKLNIKLPDIAQPIRLALTGSSASAGVYDLMNLLGKEEVLKRLKSFVRFLSERTQDEMN